MSSSDSAAPSDKFTVDEPDARARISAHTPILFDERTNEPYLPLPAPNLHYRLTPARFSDAEDVSRVLVSPRRISHPLCDARLNLMLRVYLLSECQSTLSVARNLIGPPFPYPADKCGGWFRMLRSTAVSAFDQLKEGNYQLLRGSPFCMMREGKDDGTDIYVGEVSIGLCEGKKRATSFKEGMEAWRSPAVWSTGGTSSPRRPILLKYIQRMAHSIW